MLVLARQGIAVAPFDCIMLLSYVVEGGLHGHGMDELAKLHLDYSCISFKDICGKGRNQITFDREPLDKALEYTAETEDVKLSPPELHNPHKGHDSPTTPP